jgi:hypothetical protein
MEAQRCSLSIVVLHVTEHEKCLRFYANCPTYSSDFTQNWSSSPCFHRSPQCQLSRKSRADTYAQNRRTLRSLYSLFAVYVTASKHSVIYKYILTFIPLLDSNFGYTLLTANSYAAGHAPRQQVVCFLLSFTAYRSSYHLLRECSTQNHLRLLHSPQFPSFVFSLPYKYANFLMYSFYYVSYSYVFSS